MQAPFESQAGRPRIDPDLLHPCLGAQAQLLPQRLPLAGGEVVVGKQADAKGEVLRLQI